MGGTMNVLGLAGGGLHMLLIWGLVVAGAVLAIRLLAGFVERGWDDPRDRERDDALDLLERRFARGEIDEREFERRRRRLRPR